MREEGKALRHVPISPNMCQVFTGLMLGDGNIDAEYRCKCSAKFRLSQGGENHKNFLFHVANLCMAEKLATCKIREDGTFNCINTRAPHPFKIKNGVVVLKKDGNPSMCKQSWNFQSLYTSEFLDMHKDWYTWEYDQKYKKERYVKHVPKNLTELTFRTLAYWIACDGRWNNGKFDSDGCFEICTESFNKNEVDRLADMIRALRIDCSAVLRKSHGYRIYISRVPYKNLSEEIEIYMPGGMEYKLQSYRSKI